MSKIYTVMVDDDVPLSSFEFSNNLKIICYLLYDEIKQLEINDNDILYQNDKIVYNELMEEYSVNGYVYDFLSEKHPNHEYLYEPFLIGNNGFGFSVNDNTLSEDDVLKLLNEIQTLLKTNYPFTINGYSFQKDSERLKIINSIKTSSKFSIGHGLLTLKKYFR